MKLAVGESPSGRLSPILGQWCALFPRPRSPSSAGHTLADLRKRLQNTVEVRGVEPASSAQEVSTSRRPMHRRSPVLEVRVPSPSRLPSKSSSSGSLTAELLERGTRNAKPFSCRSPLRSPSFSARSAEQRSSDTPVRAVLSAVLPFGARHFSIVTEELLTKAHETKDTNLHVLCSSSNSPSGTPLKALPESPPSSIYDPSS